MNFITGQRFFSSSLVARVLVAVVVVAAMSTPFPVRAQDPEAACRSVSELPLGQIVRIFVTPLGDRTFQVRFVVNSNHAMFCPGSPIVFCNPDKIAFLASKSSSNILEAEHDGGCHTNWFLLTTPRPAVVVFAFKVRFQENFFNGFPQGKSTKEVRVD